MVLSNYCITGILLRVFCLMCLLKKNVIWWYNWPNYNVQRVGTITVLLNSFSNVWQRLHSINTYLIIEWLPSPLLYRCGEWASERLHNLSRVTEFIMLEPRYLISKPSPQLLCSMVFATLMRKYTLGSMLKAYKYQKSGDSWGLQYTFAKSWSQIYSWHAIFSHTR